MNVTKLWSCGPAHDGGGDGGGEAQDVTYVEKANRVWEGRCIRIKTIEKMLILLPQISKFRLRRAPRWLPERSHLTHLFGAPSGKSSLSGGVGRSPAQPTEMRAQKCPRKFADFSRF